MCDRKSLADAIHKRSIQVFESQHYATLSGPSGSTFEAFHKIGLRVVVTWFVEDIICHDLNNAQPNIPGKLNRLSKDIPPLLAEFRGVATKWIFAMSAQAHRHDLHTAVSDGTTQGC